MSVRTKIEEQNGVYFITFTCAQWIPLFEITNGYSVVYEWFAYLKSKGHHIVAHVIMPNHLHAVIAFTQTEKNITAIIANGKRFMAYGLVKLLKQQGRTDLLEQLASLVIRSQRIINKQHEVFEPSFDKKECFTLKFLKQKVDYIHFNPCRKQLAYLPEDYKHSSAGYYSSGNQGLCTVITYMELQDVDLGSR